jgi:phosphoribosyl-ATP pyrophosphohydrolase/phosphoribosyl-AMP cyclohydrolase
MLIQTPGQAEALAWQKMSGLLPAIVQDAFDGRVLMQAFMNREALQQTLDGGRVTFWSRSRECLWTKGETSSNFLTLHSIHADCDQDCLLVLATPSGPTCHLGSDSCFDGVAVTAPGLAFLASLEKLIARRREERPEGSYTTRLFEAGTKRIAQKVGEEGVETALAAVAGEEGELIEESSDLVYHLLVLLQARGEKLSGVVEKLKSRHGG